jgi:truncated hemoglobin YjbI
MDITMKDDSLETFCHIGGLCQEDQAIMARIAPAIVPHLSEMTDRFYAILQVDPQTAPYIEGRVDTLKATHLMWMTDLFGGNYGEAFIQRQEKIGQVHVKVKVPPVFVAASMSFLRSAIPPIINAHVADQQESSSAVSSLLRLLDLCQYLIDRKYNEALMDNLGISPSLLMRLQTITRS